MSRANRDQAAARVFFGADDQGPFVSASRGGEVLHVERGTPRGDALELFDAAVRKAGVAREDVREIAVDRGPAGFSSVRRRVAVAAALAHALGARVAAVGSMTPEEAAALPGSDFAAEVRIAPKYDRAPNITVPKRGPAAS
jgi:hypothetical protein